MPAARLWNLPGRYSSSAEMRKMSSSVGQMTRSSSGSSASASTHIITSRWGCRYVTRRAMSSRLKMAAQPTFHAYQPLWPLSWLAMYSSMAVLFSPCAMTASRTRLAWPVDSMPDVSTDANEMSRMKKAKRCELGVETGLARNR